MSFDAMEVFASALGGVAIIFALNRDDEEKLAEILGSMGISSIIAANPIMGILVTALGGYAYWTKKKKIDGASMAKGASMAAISAAVFGILGMPILVELVIVLVVGNLLRKHVLDNQLLMQMIAGHLKRTGMTALDFGTEIIELLKTNIKEKKAA
jgi:hypothetical protein